MSALGGAVEGADVLDLFAGSGALGLESLSRGARAVVFVERARSAEQCLRSNVNLLGAGEACEIVRADAMTYVGKLAPESFDIVLADPPYDRGFAADLVEQFLTQPFASELWVEHRTSEAVPQAPGLRQRRYGDTMLTTVSNRP